MSKFNDIFVWQKENATTTVWWPITVDCWQWLTLILHCIRHSNLITINISINKFCCLGFLLNSFWTIDVHVDFESHSRDRFEFVFLLLRAFQISQPIRRWIEPFNIICCRYSHSLFLSFYPTFLRSFNEKPRIYTYIYLYTIVWIWMSITIKSIKTPLNRRVWSHANVCILYFHFFIEF